MTTPPFAGEQRFGPYCGCRYAGRPGRPDETEVWLLYNGQPYPAGLPVIAVLYNRPQAWHDPNRDDRWLARPYGPDHKGTEVRGMTGEEAARKLWMALPGGGNAAALAVAEAAAVEFECGGGCSDPPLTG